MRRIGRVPHVRPQVWLNLAQDASPISANLFGMFSSNPHKIVILSAAPHIFIA
jgi:hypothetical protein